MITVSILIVCLIFITIDQAIITYKSKKQWALVKAGL